MMSPAAFRSKYRTGRAMSLSKTSSRSLRPTSLPRRIMAALTRKARTEEAR